jgi:hypothetical protein
MSLECGDGLEVAALETCERLGIGAVGERGRLFAVVIVIIQIIVVVAMAIVILVTQRLFEACVECGVVCVIL